MNLSRLDPPDLHVSVTGYREDIAYARPGATYQMVTARRI